jgi:hypothetical protein
MPYSIIFGRVLEPGDIRNKSVLVEQRRSNPDLRIANWALGENVSVCLFESAATEEKSSFSCSFPFFRSTSSAVFWATYWPLGSVLRSAGPGLIEPQPVSASETWTVRYQLTNSQSGLLSRRHEQRLA